jgi:hypothetical protein
MKKTLSLTIIIILLISMSISLVSAQSSVNNVNITNVYADAESFPEITVEGFAFLDDGSLASGLSSDMFQIEEDGVTVGFSLAEIDAGSYTVIVFDMGKWITNKLTRDTGMRVRDVMQDAAIRYIGYMNEKDFVQVVAIYDKKPILVQDFTNDKERLRDVVTQLNWDSEGFSYGLDALDYAVSSLANQDDVASRQILFLSAGVMMVDPFGAYKDSVAASASKHDIFIHSVNVNFNWNQDLYGENAKYISEETGGYFVSYLVDEDLLPLFTFLDQGQNLYEFSYRSPGGESLTRTVSLTYLGNGGISDSEPYSIDSSWIASPKILVTVNNENPITINAEKESLAVPILVQIDGLGNRKVKKVSFFINNQEINDLDEMLDGTYSTTWSVDAIKLGLPYGDTEISVLVQVNDEQDNVYEGFSDSRITVEYALVEPCKTLSKWNAGDAIVNACVGSGLSLMTLFFGLLALGLGVLLWLKRDRVVEISENARVRVTDVVKRFTNRLMKLEPKARLIAVKGIPSGERTEFDLFGETSVGVDREFAKLILDNPNISGLHCTFHQDHEGIWTVEDQDSTNGTFVSGKRLEPFSPNEIDANSIIELAPIEYGGVRFRFEVIDPYADTESDGFENIYDDPTGSEPQETGVRITQRNTQPRPKDDDLPEIGVERSVDIDPSDPSNQSW